MKIYVGGKVRDVTKGQMKYMYKFCLIIQLMLVQSSAVVSRISTLGYVLIVLIAYIVLWLMKDKLFDYQLSKIFILINSIGIFYSVLVVINISSLFVTALFLLLVPIMYYLAKKIFEAPRLININLNKYIWVLLLLPFTFKLSDMLQGKIVLEYLLYFSIIYLFNSYIFLIVKNYEEEMVLKKLEVCK